MSAGFKITLGSTKRYADSEFEAAKLHHENDTFSEVLVDFPGQDKSEGLSLGFLCELCDIISGEPMSWALIDERGDALPGTDLLYNTRKAAITAAESYLSQRFGD